MLTLVFGPLDFLARIAMDANLVGESGGMAKIYPRLTTKEFRPNERLVLLYVDDAPIGMAHLAEHGTINVFVHQEHRRRGYGTLLVACVRTGPEWDYCGDYGDDPDGSILFWESIDVPFGPSVLERAVELESSGTDSSEALRLAQQQEYERIKSNGTHRFTNRVPSW